MSDHRLIRRIDGKTGKAEWHTLHEWNIINGYEKPDEIIPFIEVIDGEVVEEGNSSTAQPSIFFSRDAKMARLRAVARWSTYVVVSQRKRAAVKPATLVNFTGGYSGNEPTSPTMHEPC